MKTDLASFRRAVGYGMANGKMNMIADLDVLVELIAQHAELLAACELMISKVDQYQMRGGTLTESEAAAVIQMRDAIASARGGAA